MGRAWIGSLAAAAVAAAALAGTATPGTQAASPQLAARLEKALAAPGVAASRTGALAIDLRTGEVVFEANGARALAPASAEKLAVSFAALRVLGPGFRFRTEVMGTGELVGKTWQGDLFLVGYGDPTLEPADLRALAREISAWGIRRVTGRIVGDERHFDTQARRARAGSPGSSGSSPHRSRRSSSTTSTSAARTGLRWPRRRRSAPSSSGTASQLRDAR